MVESLEQMMESARVRLGLTVRRFLTGETRPPLQRFANGDLTSGDAGLFGPGSAAWKVHGDISTIVGGLRAVMLQTLHPLAMAGVADHSDFRHDALGRLHRTAGFLAATIYGTTPAAEAAIASVKAIHERVTGVAPDGRSYRADDPHLLAWIHATEVDSFLAAYQRYAPTPLGAGDADRYVAEMAQIGERLGAVELPRDVGQLNSCIDGFRPEVSAGRHAREAIAFLLVPPLPLAARGPYAIAVAAAVGLLPGWSRRLLWLPVLPGADRVVVRPACTVMLRLFGWALVGAAQTTVDEPV